MKIQLIYGLMLISCSTFAQERSLEDLLNFVEVEEGARPPTLCSDSEWPPNGQCFDFPPAVPIVEAIRESLEDDVFVNIVTLSEVEIYTGDVGLSVDEIEQRIGSITLPNGRRLIDIIFIIEGDIPYPPQPPN